MQRRAEGLQELVATGRALQLAVDSELRSTATELETLALCPDMEAAFTSEPGSAPRAAVYQRATALVRQRPDSLLNFVLFAPDGRQLLNTATPFPETLAADPAKPQPNPSPQISNTAPLSALVDHWPQIVTSSGVSLTPLFRGSVAKQNIVGMLLPVRRDGTILGMLAVGLLPTSLGQALRNASLPPGRVAAVIDQNGNIIARSLNEQSIIGTKASPQILDFQQSNRAEDLNSKQAPR